MSDHVYIIRFINQAEEKDEMRGFAEHLIASFRNEDRLCRAFYLFFAKSLVNVICLQRQIQCF